MYLLTSIVDDELRCKAHRELHTNLLCTIFWVARCRRLDYLFASVLRLCLHIFNGLRPVLHPVHDMSFMWRLLQTCIASVKTIRLHKASHGNEVALIIYHFIVYIYNCICIYLDYMIYFDIHITSSYMHYTFIIHHIHPLLFAMPH